MEIVPPSYESATTRDAWSIIAQYIPSSDLCAVSLVCRKWHAVFMPFLWGNPASHFGTENDEVYVALTRFRRTLKYARPEVRMLTHTLHMPPALSEIYGGPRPEWLREIFEYLPCLQSLIVSQLPFFDHSAMMALRGDTSNGVSSRTYNIRLLVAEREPNTTSQGIAETLLRFPELIYLDLSYTTAAKDQSVLSTISQLERLQVLKLRGLGLKDVDAEFVANAVGRKVRFLDLRDNKLTDLALHPLLNACFLPPGQAPNPRGRTPPASNSLNSLFANMSSPGFLRSPVVDETFREALTVPLTGRSWVEDLPDVGITHLYLADNQLTADGVASLLATARLHVLDVGTVVSAEKVDVNQVNAAKQSHTGSEKLIPLLATVAKENLTYLRAHHSVCTSAAPQGKTKTDDLLPELSGENGMVGFSELDTEEAQVHEMPANDLPVFELAGSTPRPQTPYRPPEDEDTMKETAPQPVPRRGSTYAPEVILGPGETTDSILSPSESYNTLSSSPIAFCTSPVSMEDPRGRKIQELLAKRPKSQPRRHGRESIEQIHPSHIPHVETLVLTDVPSHAPLDSSILDSLMNFITACSNEALLATLQAGSDYSLPPGQDRTMAEQARARSLFALRKIVLEITLVTNTLQPIKSAAWKSVSAQMGQQKSATGDWDLERLWSEASDDFSFFGETECGIPKYDQGRHSPSSFIQASSNASNVPIVDVVAELASFRRRKKGEYEQALRRHSSQRRSTNDALSLGSLSHYSGLAGSSSGRLSPSPSSQSVRALSPVPGPRSAIARHVEGHWKGEVKIVRNATPKGRTGMVDMYGNYFEKGYLYP
ncbi:uncharacterized protein BDV14DRAFT_12636 [Aspergillus stella-maris]|uniref:uncharacterized protein n=1 Tax=Aspergillus stella-maris TaxID=1810926 RepID=UPI003CCD48D4